MITSSTVGGRGIFNVGFINYKKAIASGVKELILKKSFNKISIKDITDQCGIKSSNILLSFSG